MFNAPIQQMPQIEQNQFLNPNNGTLIPLEEGEVKSLNLNSMVPLCPVPHIIKMPRPFLMPLPFQIPPPFQNPNSFQIPPPFQNPSPFQIPRPTQIQETSIFGNSKANLTNHKTNSSVKNKKSTKDYIIVKSIEIIQEVTFIINKEKTCIGRHPSNNIVIFNESSSRFHAHILKENNQFYLQDVGSIAGTFIKVNTPIELKLGMIIEMGSFQLMVKKVFVNNTNNGEMNESEDNSKSFVEFEVYEGLEGYSSDIIRLESGSKIGRSSSNTLCVHKDFHISSFHCKVEVIGRLLFMK
jgi:pSer/pThr/pTyr-binding forkhead associated (FHA) protein